MTVSTTNTVNGPYVPNGVTTAFPFTFTVDSVAGVRVQLDGAIVDPADYTVTVNTGNEGGTVTFAVAPTGSELFVASDPDFTQQSSFENSGPFLASVVEQSYDKDAVRAQYLKGEIERAVRMPIGQSGLVVDGSQDGVVGIEGGEMTFFPLGDFTGPPGTIEVSGLEFVTPLQFGAVSGGSAAVNGAAFEAAIAYLKSIAVNDDGTYKGSVPLYIPPGDYSLDRTLDITHQLRIEGFGGTANSANAVILRWPVGMTGLRFQYYNTSGAGDVGAAHHSGASASVKGVWLIGGYTSWAATPEGEYHGIHAKVAISIDDVRIENFQGDGLYVFAAAGAGPPVEGNANVINMRRCRVGNCRNGIFLEGADANAGYFEACNFNANRQWAVWDSSFLGNVHIAHHAAGNGQSEAGITPTMVSYSGNRYYPKHDQVANAKVNAPSGTTADTAYWYYYAAGGVDASRSIPAWSNGMDLRAGGAYCSDNVNAYNTGFIFCYSEGNQAGSQIELPAMLIGGIHGDGFQADAALYGDPNRKLVANFLTIAKDAHFRGTYAVLNEGCQLAFCGDDDVQRGSIIGNSTSNALSITGQSYVSFSTDSGFVGNITVNGFDLSGAGKSYYVAGNKVVGARGAALPADATDLATALTLVNAIKARIKTTGGHGLVAD